MAHLGDRCRATLTVALVPHVVRIMVPFNVPDRIHPLVFKVPTGGPQFLTPSPHDASVLNVERYVVPEDHGGIYRQCQ